MLALIAMLAVAPQGAPAGSVKAQPKTEPAVSRTSEPGVGASASAEAPVKVSADFDEKIASVIILQSKVVQQELNVSPKQRDSMNEFADKHRAKLQAYAKKLEAQSKKDEKPVEPDQKVLEGHFATMKEGVLGVLSEYQLRRLREISLQEMGVAALADNTVAKEVGLNETQLKKIRDIITENLKNAQEIQTKAGQPIAKKYQNEKPKDEKEAQELNQKAQKELEAALKKVQPRLDRIRTSTISKVEDVLDEKQLARWKALLGEPFEPPKS